MAYRRYNNYQKKYISYKQYTHLTFKEILKKQENLEKEKKGAEENLSGLRYIGSLRYELIEKMQPIMKKEITIINSLINNYNLTLKQSKPFFAKIMYMNPAEDCKPILKSINKDIKIKIDNLKSIIKKQIESAYIQVPSYSYLKKQHDKSYEKINIDLIKNDIEFCTRKFPYVDYDTSKWGWTEIKEIEDFYIPNRLHRSDKIESFIREGCSEFIKEIESTEKYLKPIKTARSIIEKKHDQEEAKLNRIKEEASKYKAQAYAHQQKTRDLSEEIKKEIKNQENIFPVCPYCEQSLGLEPHADHIYPVTLGGLGTKENMVYVCSKCNQSKGPQTLREFIKKKDLNRDRVENNLSLLGKKF